MAPEMRVWSPEQLRAFLEHVQDDRLYAAWLLLATTGMRRGEVASLRWVDVDLDAGRVSPRRPRIVVNYEVVVSEPKTAKGRRSLALDPATVAALREHRGPAARGAAGGRPTLAGLGPGVHLAGRPTAPPGALLQMVRATRSGGRPPEDSAARRPHSYATAALAAGIPAKIVSERLGHANIAITMDTYSHVLPGLDAQAAGTVARLILGKPRRSTRSDDKPLTSGPRAARRRREVKGEPAGQELGDRGDSNPRPSGPQSESPACIIPAA
jgi:integrase